MKKALTFLIGFFVVVSVIVGFYSAKSSDKNKETIVSSDSTALYPEDLRGNSFIANEEESEPTDDELSDEEITADETFKEFDLEEVTQGLDEEQPQPVEEQPQPEPSAPAQAEQPTPAEQTAPATGRTVQIVISKVNARILPSNSGKIVGVFKVGEQGIMVEEGESWSIIRVGEVEGYVYNRYWQYI